MSTRTIELHCHTVFSVDGHCTPEEVVDCAAANGVGVLSITDHNCLGATHRAAARAAHHGIQYLPGVEVDAIFEGGGHHFLAFGIDPDDRALNALLAHNRKKYKVRFEVFFEELVKLGFPYSREELEGFLPVRYPTNPNPVLSTYLITAFLEHLANPDVDKLYLAARDKVREQAKANPALYDEVRFADYDEALNTVHNAGGVLLLAHVGYSAVGDPAGQIGLIRSLTSRGLDGFELYHHKNRDAHPFNRDAPNFDNLMRLGEELGCLRSGGSDCHNATAAQASSAANSGAPDPSCRPVIGGCGAPMELIQPLLSAVGGC